MIWIIYFYFPCIHYLMQIMKKGVLKMSNQQFRITLLALFIGVFGATSSYGAAESHIDMNSMDDISIESTAKDNDQPIACGKHAPDKVVCQKPYYQSCSYPPYGPWSEEHYCCTCKYWFRS